MAEPVPNAIPSATMLPNAPIMDLCCGGWPTGGGAPPCCAGVREVATGLGAPSAVVSFVCTFHQYVCPVVSSLTSSHVSSIVGGGAALPTGLLAPRNLPRPPLLLISRVCTEVAPPTPSSATAESPPSSRRPTERSTRRVAMLTEAWNEERASAPRSCLSK